MLWGNYPGNLSAELEFSGGYLCEGGDFPWEKFSMGKVSIGGGRVLRNIFHLADSVMTGKTIRNSIKSLSSNEYMLRSIFQAES